MPCAFSLKSQNNNKMKKREIDAIQCDIAIYIRSTVRKNIQNILEQCAKQKY